MNELENAPIRQDETNEAAQNITEAAQDQNVQESVEVAEIENEQDVDQEEGVDPRRYHQMSKEELLAELKRIVDEDLMSMNKEVTSIKQAFHAIRTREIEEEINEYLEQGNDPTTFTSSLDEAESEFKDLMAQFKEKRTKYVEEQENIKIENLQKKKAVIDNIKSIIEDIDNINLHYPRFRELQNEFISIKNIPATAEGDIWKEYQALVEQFYEHLKMNKELRDLDYKKNLEAKKSLIEKAKELDGEKDIVNAGRRLQELHDKWREIGPVAKEFREEIWEEFKAASTVIRRKHQEFFEARKATEAENEAAKTALIGEAEAIDFSEFKNAAQWDEATKKILDIQARWKELGFASRKMNAQLFSRFREICDRFFNAKTEYFKRTREELASNLEKKTKLCEKAEALAQAEDKSKVIDQVRKLQAEWKEIGGVARRHSDAIWQRFSQACNSIYEERKRKYSAIRKEEMENLEAKREVIAKLTAINPEGMNRSEGIAAVRELQTAWQNIGHVPFKMKDKLYEEYRAQCDRLYDAFDFSGARRRMENFENRMSNIGNDDSKLSRERERLYRAYEQKRAELKTYENNVGFFTIKSNSGNSMLKEMDKKIARIKEELNDLKHKIEVIDEKFK